MTSAIAIKQKNFGKAGSLKNMEMTWIGILWWWWRFALAALM